MLGDPEIPDWDKIELYSSLARLGYNEVAGQFLTFLQSFRNKQWYRTWPKDLFPVLQIAATFLSNDVDLSFVNEIANHLEERMEKLTSKQRDAFGELLCALGMVENGKRYMKTTLTNLPKTSLEQESVFSSIRDNIKKDSKLSYLKVHSEVDIGGRCVDIVIDNFKNPKNKPIACEVDSLFHVCCNDTTRSLGKNIIRNKLLRNLGYVVFVLLPYSQDSSINGLMRLIRNKIEHDKKEIKKVSLFDEDL